MDRPIPVRHPAFDFTEVPRHYVRDDPRMTHVVNGLSAVFPEGEQFFVRSVAGFADQLPEAQRERLKGFYGQEGSHGRAHRATFEMLERQGYEIRSWLHWYKEHAYGVGVETRVPPEVRLATTVALEHLTATLAEVAFDEGDVVYRMHPEMKALLQWHAAEEIEHKAVAFDVLAEVDPRLRLRILGFAIGLSTLLFYAGSAGAHLARQDGIRGVRRRLFFEVLRRPRVVRMAVDFFRRDFHPDQTGNDHLAEAFLAKLSAAA